MDGDATDISNSPAFVALDALLMEGKLSQAVVDMYKSKYAQLHDYVIQTYEREKNLLTRAKVLNQELLGERIQLEKQSIHRHEELQALTNLEKEKELALKELHDCEERDMILQYELSHLEMENKESEETATPEKTRKIGARRPAERLLFLVFCSRTGDVRT